MDDERGNRTNGNPEGEELKVETSWYALHTRSRHEKRVAEILHKRGFDTYLPLMSRVSEWHDRNKVVQWPLFPGYVFVRFTSGNAASVLSVPGSVQVVGLAGRPAPIPDEDIENVRRFAACLAETGILPKSVPHIGRGQPVAVQSGPFAGVRGIVLEHRAAGRVLIQIGLGTIGQALKIELNSGNLDRALVPGDAERDNYE